EWVTSHFLPMFRRPLGGEYRWCPQWWPHAEAITRLTALWHTWEALRLQPGTGMATWLRDHLDHQLPVLLGRTGPFSMCSEDDHRAILPRLHHAIADLAVCIDGIAQATAAEHARQQLTEGIGRLLSGCTHLSAASTALSAPGAEPDAEPVITTQPAHLSAAD